MRPYAKPFKGAVGKTHIRHGLLDENKRSTLSGLGECFGYVWLQIRILHAKL